MTMLFCSVDPENVPVIGEAVYSVPGDPEMVSSIARPGAAKVGMAAKWFCESPMYEGPYMHVWVESDPKTVVRAEAKVQECEAHRDEAMAELEAGYLKWLTAFAEIEPPPPGVDLRKMARRLARRNAR